MQIKLVEKEITMRVKIISLMSVFLSVLLFYSAVFAGWDVLKDAGNCLVHNNTKTRPLGSWTHLLTENKKEDAVKKAKAHNDCKGKKLIIGE